MQVLEFGDESKKKIILVHGFQMPYQIWNRYIEHYEKDFCVLVPVMSGHYPNHVGDFVSFSETAKEFEDYYLPKYGSEVFTVYAMSMGGVLAATLWQNNKLKIENLILDGSPLLGVNQFIGKQMVRFYLDITHKSQQGDSATLKQAESLCPQDCFGDFLKVLDAMTDTTIRNCVKGVASFRLSGDSDNRGTKIYYYHGSKINELLAKKTARFISKNYKSSIIKSFQGKGHCETMLFEPQIMIKELDGILK